MIVFDIRTGRRLNFDPTSTFPRIHLSTRSGTDTLTVHRSSPRLGLVIARLRFVPVTLRQTFL